MASSSVIREIAELRNRTHVFRDRAHAGTVLAELLVEYSASDSLVLGIPAGGVPVAAEIARQLQTDLDVMPVSKALFPWTTEAGFGAVAFDGTEWINQDVVTYYRLSNEVVAQAIEQAREKVRRRLQRFRGNRLFPELAGRTVILIDDGVAAGSTLRAAIAAVRKHNAAHLVVATPTGHDQAVFAIAREVDVVFCANIRGGYTFAVASAYENWTDVTDDEVATILGGNSVLAGQEQGN